MNALVKLLSANISVQKYCAIFGLIKLAVADNELGANIRSELETQYGTFAIDGLNEFLENRPGEYRTHPSEPH